jgi:hypothetical protein
MNEKIHKYQERIFNVFIKVTYAMLFLSIFSSSFEFSHQYLLMISTYLPIYVCLFLIWRFNPFRTHYEFTNLDRKIAFSAGIIILTTTMLNKYIEYIKAKVKQVNEKLKDQLNPLTQPLN